LALHATRAIERIAFRSPLREIDEARILSGALHLSGFSKLHGNYTLELLCARIGPSLPLEQFVYYVDRVGAPVGFCNWVWLSEAVLRDVLTSSRELDAAEFRCGDRPFFYEFLAPFGHARTIVRGLRELSFFKGRRIPAIRVKVAAEARSIPRVAYFEF
jgi:cytolysin-activating lysine-acyltransferase